MDFIDDHLLVDKAVSSAQAVLMRGGKEQEAIDAAKAVVAAALAAEKAISDARESE